MEQEIVDYKKDEFGFPIVGSKVRVTDVKRTPYYNRYMVRQQRCLDDEISCGFEMLAGDEYTYLRKDQFKVIWQPEGASTSEEVDAPSSNDEGWIEWGGGDCPVGGDVVVDVKFRNGTDICAKQAWWWRWNFEGSSYDIVAYRISSQSASTDEEQSPIGDANIVTHTPHYMLIPSKGIEVKHITEAWCDKIDALDEKTLTTYQASWIVQSIQYILRAPFKGTTVQDLKKAVETLTIAIDNIENKT